LALEDKGLADPQIKVSGFYIDTGAIKVPYFDERYNHFQL
jgi:hypothetical protein